MRKKNGAGEHAFDFGLQYPSIQSVPSYPMRSFCVSKKRCNLSGRGSAFSPRMTVMRFDGGSFPEPRRVNTPQLDGHLIGQNEQSVISHRTSSSVVPSDFSAPFGACAAHSPPPASKAVRPRKQRVQTFVVLEAPIRRSFLG